MQKMLPILYILVLLLTGCGRSVPDYEKTLVFQKTGTPMPTAMRIRIDTSNYIIFRFDSNPWELKSMGSWRNNKTGFMFGSGLEPWQDSISLDVFFPNLRTGTFKLGYLVHSNVPSAYKGHSGLEECLFHEPCVMIHKYAQASSDKFVEGGLCKAILDGQIVVERTRLVKGHFEFTCRTALDEDVFIKGEFEERQR